ncbi:MAG: FHA domain-containing protein [Anaerolineales bacterium]|nr:FHA domain-containing protein [Anaerolineales bacterium]
MWILTIRYHDQDPYTLNLKPGSTIIGRRLDNGIILSDTSVSRDHAEIRYDPKANKIEIRDLGSANGTQVNGNPIGQDSFLRLYNNDVIQLGLHQITLSHARRSVHTSQLLSHKYSNPVTELTPSAPDCRASLICQVARQLDTIIDTETFLNRVSDLLRESMDADKCEVIPAIKFGHIQSLGFSETIARIALEKQKPVLVPNPHIESAGDLSESAGRLLIYSALCAPVFSMGKTTALIYLYKTNPNKQAYGENDLDTIEAISHMVSLTLERLDLYERVRQEQRLRQLLQRNLAPERVDSLIQNYLRTGRLPGLNDAHATILFADIADSTGLAVRIGARQFGEILKRYYQNSTHLIFENGGLLDKFLGDGIMATFGMNNGGDNPEERAVRTGLAMLEMIEMDQDAIRLGIGVNTGSVVAGYVTTTDRIEFTVVGEAVNVAFKLQEIARPNRLFVGQSTYEAIQTIYHTTSIGPISVKGLAHPVNTYEVLK